jgi:hypothetical protein
MSTLLGCFTKGICYNTTMTTPDLWDALEPHESLKETILSCSREDLEEVLKYIGVDIEQQKRVWKSGQWFEKNPRNRLVAHNISFPQYLDGQRARFVDILRIMQLDELLYAPAERRLIELNRAKLQAAIHPDRKQRA